MTQLTVSIFVSMSGGSTSLATDSMKTKKAITIRKRPLIKPERISTRPYLKANVSTFESKEWVSWTNFKAITNEVVKCLIQLWGVFFFFFSLSMPQNQALADFSLATYFWPYFWWLVHNCPCTNSTILITLFFFFCNICYKHSNPSC